MTLAGSVDAPSWSSSLPNLQGATRKRAKGTKWTATRFVSQIVKRKLWALVEGPHHRAKREWCALEKGHFCVALAKAVNREQNLSAAGSEKFHRVFKIMTTFSASLLAHSSLQIIALHFFVGNLRICLCFFIFAIQHFPNFFLYLQSAPNGLPGHTRANSCSRELFLAHSQKHAVSNLMGGFCHLATWWLVQWDSTTYISGNVLAWGKFLVTTGTSFDFSRVTTALAWPYCWYDFIRNINIEFWNL